MGKDSWCPLQIFLLNIQLLLGKFIVFNLLLVFTKNPKVLIIELSHIKAVELRADVPEACKGFTLESIYLISQFFLQIQPLLI